MTLTSAHDLFWMAIRYLVSKKKRTLSFMTVASVLGVMIGVGALMVVLSVMAGFENDLRQKMLEGLPHAEIYAKEAVLGFSMDEVPLSWVAAELPDAHVIEPFIKADVVAKRKKSMAIASLFGIDPDVGGRCWGFGVDELDRANLKLLSAPTDSGFPPVILGEQVATAAGVYVGDVLEVLNPSVGVGGGMSGQKLVQPFEIVGLIWATVPHLDARYLITTLDAARPFMHGYDAQLDRERYVTGIGVKVSHPDHLLPKPDWSAKGLRMATWHESNASLIAALQLEKVTMTVILFLIVVVAMFSLSGTIMMTVHHKRSQIALLRAIGMSRRDIVALFLIHGMCIASVGVLLGAAMGYGICWFIDSFAAQLPLPSSFALSHLPIRYLPQEYLMICLGSWLLAIVAAVYPAYSGSQRAPCGGIKCS